MQHTPLRLFCLCSSSAHRWILTRGNPLTSMTAVEVDLQDMQRRGERRIHFSIRSTAYSVLYYFLHWLWWSDYVYCSLKKVSPRVHSVPNCAHGGCILAERMPWTEPFKLERFSRHLHTPWAASAAAALDSIEAVNYFFTPSLLDETSLSSTTRGPAARFSLGLTSNCAPVSNVFDCERASENK